MKKRIMMMVLLLAALCLAVSSAEDATERKLVVDTAHTSDGYIVVQGPDTDRELSVVVEKDGREVRYPLGSDPEILPLQLGDGEYTVTLYEVVREPDAASEFESTGEIQDYLRMDQAVIEAELESSYSCYLHPNLYVDYDADSPWALKAGELAEGDTDPLLRYEYVTNYIVKNYQFDFIKEVTTAGPNKLPDVAYCWENKRGIAGDLSALTCAMLRSLGIPAVLVSGTIGQGTPHFWVIAVVNDDYIIFDPTARLNASNKTELLYSILFSGTGGTMTY